LVTNVALGAIVVLSLAAPSVARGRAIAISTKAVPSQQSQRRAGFIGC
jgi:hypothetical protein